MKAPVIRWRDEEMEVVLEGAPPIRVSPWLLMVAVVLTTPFWVHLTTRGLMVTGLLIVMIPLSVLAHEFGHANVARLAGLRCTMIRLHPGGGEALIDGEPFSRRADRQIVLAGPAVSLALGLVCLAAAWLLAAVPSPRGEGAAVWLNAPPGSPSAFVEAVHWIGCANVIFAAVNMLPAFPLDGGRVAFNVLEARWGSRRALLCVGVSGVALACCASLAFIMTTILAVPVWSPPYFGPNVAAVAAARRMRARGVPRRRRGWFPP